MLLEQKIAEIREQLGQLEKASAAFVTHTGLVEGLRTQAHIRQFHLTIDEPQELGGTDAGPNPVELVLAALGTCQEIVYAVYAAILGVKLERIEIFVEGRLDPRGFFGVAEAAPGFREVRYQVRIESPTEPQRVEALVRAVQEHCPVLDILKRPMQVTGGVELNGSPLMEV
jgi:putative redox protein